jgi:4-methyl-5(b-hydroxyethyl)-thiazole monophosphate biosynthesis
MKKILLLLAEGFELYEASAFIDVIGWNLVDGDHSTQLFSCGLKKELKTSFGQTFIVNHLIDEVNSDEYDALAIPGGFEEYDFYNDAYNNKYLELIRDFSRKNKIIASICVGSLPIGKSGALDNRMGTTYSHKSIRQETLRGFGVNVLDKPIVIDDNIITSWDPSTAIDVAFILLEKLTSIKNASHIKDIMGFATKKIMPEI